MLDALPSLLVALIFLIVMGLPLVGYLLFNTFPKSFRISNKTVLITGVSHGNIGHSLSKICAKTASTLILVHHKAHDIGQVMKDCLSHGCTDILSFEVDLTNQAETNEFLSKLPSIHLAIFLHTISTYGDCLSVSMEDYRKNFEVNVLSHINLSQHLVPILKKNSGKLIVTSSLAGVIPLPKRSAYGVSKAALTSFYGSLAIENPDLSISVIFPGMVDTPPVRVEYDSETIKTMGALNPEHLARQVLESTEFFCFVPFTGWLVHVMYVFFPRFIINYLVRVLPKTKSGQI